MPTREILATTLLMVWLAPVAGAQSPYPRSSEHLEAVQRAQDALAQKRYETATAMAEAVLKRAPAHRDAAAVKIAALSALGDRPGALTAYEAWVQASRREDVTLLLPLARSELQALVATPLPVVQGGALEALASSGDQDARRELERAFRADTPTTLTWEATEALARLGHDDARRRILQAAGQGGGGARVRALQALKTLSGEIGLAEAVRGALGSGDVMLQVAAADLAGARSLTAVVGDLKRAFATAEPFARLWVAGALRRLGDAGGDSALRAALAADVADTRLLAAAAFKDAGQPGWVERIAPLLKAPEALNRLYAAELLLDDDRPASLAVLKKGLEDPNHVIRGEAARILTRTGAGDLWTLRWMLRDGAPLVRYLAARTLLEEGRGAGL
jgi:hypothetical protein